MAEPLDAGIGKSPHPAIGAEVVVKRAVLLDQDHDMLDVREHAARPRSGQGIGHERVGEHRCRAQRDAARGSTR